MAAPASTAAQNYLHPMTQVFIGNLTPAITAYQLRTFCEDVIGVGNVKKVILPSTTNSKKFAFVHLQSEEDAGSIILALNDRWMGGTKLRVSFARNKTRGNQNSVPQLEPRLQEIPQHKIGKSDTDMGITPFENFKSDTRMGVYHAGEPFLTTGHTGQENQSLLPVANVESAQVHQTLHPFTIEHVVALVLSYMSGPNLINARLVSTVFNRAAVGQLRRRQILKLDLNRDLGSGTGEASWWRLAEIPKANLTDTMNLSPLPFVGLEFCWESNRRPTSGGQECGSFVERLSHLVGDLDKFFDACRDITKLAWVGGSLCSNTNRSGNPNEDDSIMRQGDLVSFLLNPKRYPNLVKLQILQLPDNIALTAGSFLNSSSASDIDKFQNLKQLEIRDNNRHNFCCDFKRSPTSYFRDSDVRGYPRSSNVNEFVRFGTDFIVDLLNIAPNLESLAFKKTTLPEVGEEFMETLRIVQLPFLAELHLGFDLNETDVVTLIRCCFQLRKCTLAWLTPHIKAETLESFIFQQSSSLVELTIGDGFFYYVHHPNYYPEDRYKSNYCENPRIQLYLPTMPKLKSLEFKRLETGLGYVVDLRTGSYSSRKFPNLEKLRVRVKDYDPGYARVGGVTIHSFFPELDDEPNESVREVALESVGSGFSLNLFAKVSSGFPQMRKLKLTKVLPAILTALWSIQLPLEELHIENLILEENIEMNFEDVDVDSVLTGLSPKVCRLFRHELRTQNRQNESKWMGILDNFNFKRQPSLCSLTQLRSLWLSGIGGKHDHCIYKGMWRSEMNDNTDWTYEEPRGCRRKREQIHGIYNCVTSAMSDVTGYAVFMQMTKLTSLTVHNSFMTAECLEILREKLQLLYKFDIPLEQRSRLLTSYK